LPESVVSSTGSTSTTSFHHLFVPEKLHCYRSLLHYVQHSYTDIVRQACVRRVKLTRTSSPLLWVSASTSRSPFWPVNHNDKRSLLPVFRIKTVIFPALKDDRPAAAIPEPYTPCCSYPEAQQEFSNHGN
jgi:hypothetical protein